mgnify:CR=1 FL=1
MCSINVGIGHDDDLVISQFGNIEIIMDSCTECSDHCLDLGITVDLIQSCLLYIQDLSTKWQDRLGRSVTGCLCRTSRRVSLYNVDLTLGWILV